MVEVEGLLERIFSDKKIFVVFLVGIVIVSAVSLALVFGGSVPSPIPGVGKKVAKVEIIVRGVYEEKFFEPDYVKIESIDYRVIDWYNALLYVFRPLHSFDTGNARLEYEIYDSLGNKVGSGSKEFKMSSAWEQRIIVNLEPGTYRVIVKVYEFWKVFLSSGWDFKDQKEVEFTIIPPSE